MLEKLVTLESQISYVPTEGPSQSEASDHKTGKAGHSFCQHFLKYFYFQYQMLTQQEKT